MHRSFTTATCGIVLAGAFFLVGDLRANTGQQPDNTAANKADQNPAVQTADQAKNNLTDRELMSHIRRDVVKDKSLSTYGHNVKIIAEHGKVTLKGPVHSEDEKHAIEEHAKKYSSNVDDQLTVKQDGK